ncbi:MAG: alkane 1-monooxygenase [Paracoccaceae bacterium]
MRLASFVIATLLPAGLLALGSVWGGAWIWAGALSVMILWLAMDKVTLLAPADRAGRAIGDGLLVVLAILQFTHLALGIRAITIGLEGWDRVAAFAGFGVFLGQIGNPAAHELIHRSQRGLFRLGAAVYALMLFGHHVSAHRLVHHVHVGTPQDPNSARRGMGFWRFLPRAWIGSFRAGLAAERARSKASGRRNPYAVYLLASALFLGISALLFGPMGVVVHAALAAYAQSQLLVSDYVQHYGLRRSLRPDGKAEPVGPRHSWNARGWYSSAMMLNAPRHSDHHAHPSRPYPQLDLTPEMPLLPAPLPAMAMLALVPPLWRRVMDPRLDRLAAN